MDCGISETELMELITKYTKYHSNRLSQQFHKSGNIVEDEIEGLLGLAAAKAIIKYGESTNHRAKLRSYIISSFRNKIIDYVRKVTKEIARDKETLNSIMAAPKKHEIYQ